MRALFGQLYRLVPRPVARALLWAANDKFNFGAVGLFLTPDRRVLVLHHVYRHRYAWGLPGGYLHRGETPEDGLLRELREETGLAASIDGVFCIDEVDAFQKEVVFLGRIDPGQMRPGQSLQLNYEIHDAVLAPLDALPGDMLPRHAALVARLGRTLDPELNVPSSGR